MELVVLIFHLNMIPYLNHSDIEAWLVFQCMCAFQPGASSYRVLNQLRFSALSKALRARAPRRMSGRLSECAGVGGRVSCYHDHTRGQRSQAAGPRGGETRSAGQIA